MIFLPSRNIWTPQRKWGQRKLQRGIICATAVYSGKEPLLVSGTNVNASEEGFAVSGRVPSTGSAFTNVTVTGGIGPFTYAWTKQTDADGPDFVQSGATLKNNGWYGTRSDLNLDNTETWKVVVTDTGDSNNTAEDTISVTLIWTNLS